MDGGAKSQPRVGRGMEECLENGMFCVCVFSFHCLEDTREYVCAVRNGSVARR